MVTPEKVLSPCNSQMSRMLCEKVRSCRDSGPLLRQEVCVSTAGLYQVINTRDSFALVWDATSTALAVADCTSTVLTIWDSGCASCILLCCIKQSRPMASPLWSCLFLWAHEELWLGSGDCCRDFGHTQVFSARIGHASWRFSCS